MKWLSTIASFGLMVMLTVGSSGCKKGDKQTASTSGGTEKFTLNGPGDVTIKHGDTKEIKVTIDRKEGFKTGDVTVKLTDLPKGVEADTTEKKIEKDHTSCTFNLTTAKVAEDGVVGTAKIEAEGGGAKANASFKVTVEKRKKS